MKSARTVVWIVLSVLAVLLVVTGCPTGGPALQGAPLATNPQAASVDSKTALDEFVASPPSGSQEVNQRVERFQQLVQTNPNDGGAQLGLALAQIVQSVDQASTQTNFNPYVYVPAQPANLMQLRQVLQRRARLAEPLVRVLDQAFARGSASVASVRQDQQEGPTPPQVQEVIRQFLLPIIGGGGLPTNVVGAIERLQPLVNFEGVLVSIVVTDPETQQQQIINIYGADIEIIEVILRWLRGGLLMLISRDFDPTGFQFDRTPQQVDTSPDDDQLAPSEYLPGDPFLTLLPGISGYPAGGQLMQYALSSYNTALQRFSDAVSRIVAINDPNGLVPPPEFPQEVLSTLNDLRELLSGPQTVQLTLLNRTDGTQQNRSIQVDLTSPAVNDLKDLAPTFQITTDLMSGEERINPIFFPDLTFGGLFPSPGLPEDLITGQYEVVGIQYASIILPPTPEEPWLRRAVSAR